MDTAAMAVAMPHKNWDRVQPLFQSLVSDFGNETGGRMIDFCIMHLGGVRLSIPRRMGPKYKKSESYEVFSEFYDLASRTFGLSASTEIMRQIFMHLKGTRITFVSASEIAVMERNRKIRDLRVRDSLSISVLAERFGVDEVTVWRALRE